MTINDPRIGRYAGNPPTKTLCGNPCSPPFPGTYGLGSEHYAVKDIFLTGDWEATLAELRKVVIDNSDTSKRGIKAKSNE